MCVGGDWGLVVRIVGGVLVDLTEVTYEQSLEGSEGLSPGDIQGKKNQMEGTPSRC